MTLTLKLCLNDYIVEVLKPRRCDTGRAEIAAAHLCEFFGADKPVAEIKRKDGRRYREARLAAGVSDSTIRREMGVFNAASRHAMEEERIGAAPVFKLTDEGRPRKRWLTEDEVMKLMEQPMSSRARNFLYLALGTGARKTAIVTAKVKQVDLAGGFIDYDDPSLPVTKKRRPVVKIADWLMPRVREMCAGKKPSDTLIGLDGPQNVGREVKKILRSAGIDEHGIACHVFRKTFSMWALLNGANIKDVADALGDNVVTVEKNYTAAHPQGTGRATNAIPSPERT